MKKKQFNQLAEVFKQYKPQPEKGYYGYSVWANIVKATANICYENNSKFDRLKFYKACELDKDFWGSLI